MFFYVTALSLPVKGRFIVLHKHQSESQLSWTASDRESYLSFLSRVDALYREGSTRATFHPGDLGAIYDPDLEPIEATNRILPFFVRCYAPNGRTRLSLLSEAVNQVEIIKACGRDDKNTGVRLCVIAKAASRLELSDEGLKRVSELAGKPLDSAYFDTLEGRSDPSLIALISGSYRDYVKSGIPKIVAIPLHEEVRLTRNHRGEFVSQIPKTWS